MMNKFLFIHFSLSNEYGVFSLVFKISFNEQHRPHRLVLEYSSYLLDTLDNQLLCSYRIPIVIMLQIVAERYNAAGMLFTPREPI